jgi:hypothetical protein
MVPASDPGWSRRLDTAPAPRFEFRTCGQVPLT